MRQYLAKRDNVPTERTQLRQLSWQQQCLNDWSDLNHTLFQISPSLFGPKWLEKFGMPNFGHSKFLTTFLYQNGLKGIGNGQNWAFQIFSNYLVKKKKLDHWSQSTDTHLVSGDCQTSQVSVGKSGGSQVKAGINFQGGIPGLVQRYISYLVCRS